MKQQLMIIALMSLCCGGFMQAAQPASYFSAAQQRQLIQLGATVTVNGVAYTWNSATNMAVPVGAPAPTGGGGSVPLTAATMPAYAAANSAGSAGAAAQALVQLNLVPGLVLPAGTQVDPQVLAYIGG